MQLLDSFLFFKMNQTLFLSCMNYISDCLFKLLISSPPVAKIEPARSVTSKELLAPKVAAFSSRGPAIDYADVIKVPTMVALGSRH
jgi:hypothetical protein